MLRDSRRALRTLGATLILVLAASACGIKGPLTPAKKPEPEAAKEATKPAAPAKP